MVPAANVASSASVDTDPSSAEALCGGDAYREALSRGAMPVGPPLAPMLARLVRELPVGALSYEQKWDGFRCLAFASGDRVDLRSRHDRPLARYFPEVVAALDALVAGLGGAGSAGVALDGEILLAATVDGDGDLGPRVGFGDLMSRLHPAASRVERLARELPARYVVFDVLADGSADVRDHPFRERRERLEAMLAAPPPGLALTPSTRDPAVARRWLELERAGIDGVVAKPDDLPYEPNRRSMWKVKRQKTADCVLAGIRLLPDGSVSSLLLGLYAGEELRHIGVVTQLPRAERRALVDELRPLVVPLDEHPWRRGFTIGASPLGRLRGSAARWTPEMDHDWVPLRPERAVEIAFDQVDGDRLRHPARLVRWRPDRDPRSCSMAELRPALGTHPVAS